MSATDELKSCPFCGGENLASNWHSPFIVCNDCGAFGPGNADSTHEQAVEAWNTRAELGSGKAKDLLLRTFGLAQMMYDCWLEECKAGDNVDVSACNAYSYEFDQIAQAMFDMRLDPNDSDYYRSAELGSETCELVETDSYRNENETIHVLECSVCGKTCEHVNGSYPKCPHCGKAVKR